MNLMLWGEIEVTRLAVTRSRTQDTSGLSCQCSATEPRQPDNYQPSKSSTYIYCTGGTECFMQLHTRQPLRMCHQNSVRGWLENSLHQERIHAKCFSHSKCSEHLAFNYVRSTPELSPIPSLYHTHTVLNSAGERPRKAKKPQPTKFVCSSLTRSVLTPSQI